MAAGVITSVEVKLVVTVSSRVLVRVISGAIGAAAVLVAGRVAVGSGVKVDVGGSGVKVGVLVVVRVEVGVGV